MQVILKNARVAFPNFFEAKTIAGGSKPVYSCAFLIPKDHPQIKEIEAAVTAVATEKWKEKGAGYLKASKAKDRYPLKDGDAKADWAGFEGNYFINSSNAMRPVVIDRDKTPLTAADGKPYGGSYVVAILDFWPQDNDTGRHVNCSLMGVQFLKDGEKFGGGGVASTDDFEDLSAEDDEDLM